MKLKKILLILVVLGLLLFLVDSVQAQSLVPEELANKCKLGPEAGSCTPCDFVQLFVNASNILVGLSGAFAVLMFVYGGILMAISRGHSDQVQKGKDVLTNAVKGVIIVLASWMVINYGLAVMIQPKLDLSKVSLFGNKTNWATVACKSESKK